MHSLVWGPESLAAGRPGIEPQQVRVLAASAQSKNSFKRQFSVPHLSGVRAGEDLALHRLP